MSESICTCPPNPLCPKTYDIDELVAMPTGERYVIIHEPCGKLAREDWETS